MNRRLKYFIGCLLTVLSLLETIAGNDSLAIKLKSAKNDSVRIDLLIKAAGKKDNPASYSDSLLKVVAAFQKSGDCFTKAFSYYKTGLYHISKDSPGKALENIIQSLRISDSCRLDRLIMLCRSRLAFVYKTNDNFSDAIKNSHHALAYSRRLKDSVTMAESFTLLGNMYKTEMKLDSALFYHNAALGIRERRDDKFLLSLSYNNLGLVYKNKKEYDKALYYLRRSLTLKKEIKDKTIYSAYNNMSIVFKHLKMHDSALYYAQIVIDEASRQKSGKALLEGLSCMAEANEAKGDFPKAYYYLKREKLAEDSINKEKLSAVQLELQSKYESDKKDSEIKLKEESLKTADALNSKKNVLIDLSSLAFMLALLAGVFIYRSYRQSRENAKQLVVKNREIEEKNKEITDSINYARNIQHSLLTSADVFKKNSRDHFIFYLPKDIVSGDFYWAENAGDSFLVLCGDCTGHGVPGAFMSLLGISHISEIVNREKVHSPEKILDRLRERVIDSFALSNSKDGMDASLIRISGNTLEVAAANNSVWLIRNGENNVIKPDKFPIGNYFGQHQAFTLNKTDLKEGDLIILFTDGFADQFGGAKNKKFKYKQLEKLVVSHSHLSMSDLRSLLELEYYHWKGKNEQIDDILVIGLRV